jgi:hypothetical protein
MARTPSPTGLYWSERGAIGCAAHTPFQGSDTWVWERWEPVPVEAIDIAKTEAGLRVPRCEICATR